MSEKVWWSSYGCFEPWKLCPSRPDPAEILLFYLDKQGIEPEKYVTYLMNLLNLQKSMVYNILKGQGFDSITRCRQLVDALKIHPPLLGIDAQYYPIERHEYWWQSCGFSFNADSLGYPVMCEVISYLRMQRTQIVEGRVKMWSQEDLGCATGLKKETIYRMEHSSNPLVLESMSRRAIVASALGSCVGANEPTIFRLLSLDPQAYRVQVSECPSVPIIHLSTQRLSDDMLTGYQQQLTAFFIDYSTSSAQDAKYQVQEWVKQFPALMPLASTTAQRIGVLALQSRAHRLLAYMAREQCATKSIFFHTAKALEQAEQAITLHHPNGESDRRFLVTTNELLASALFTTALAEYRLEKFDQAQAHIDRALNLLKALQSKPLKTELLGAAALIHASTATSPMDQQIVLSYINQAAGLNTPSQSLSLAPDDNFFSGCFGMLYIYKAEALISPNMKGATAEKLLDILDDAQRLIDPQMIRQQISIEVLQAQTYFAEGGYQQATEVALLALEKCWQVRSRFNRDRLEKLHQRLLNTSFSDKPLLAYLGVKLRTWDHEVG